MRMFKTITLIINNTITLIINEYSTLMRILVSVRTFQSTCTPLEQVTRGGGQWGCHGLCRWQNECNILMIMFVSISYFRHLHSTRASDTRWRVVGVSRIVSLASSASLCNRLPPTLSRQCPTQRDTQTQRHTDTQTHRTGATTLCDQGQPIFQNFCLAVYVLVNQFVSDLKSTSFCLIL